ncbi:unnamed protein product [Paramecium sonneborni]|uniref:Uncharacterized protein n=1 Tax=Paramecium sonneborni TaxID=65129 RepID=A0A8S1NAR7_9CILI|nr:unnamed protein product [Paramecium sonneborni]
MKQVIKVTIILVQTGDFRKQIILYKLQMEIQFIFIMERFYKSNTKSLFFKSQDLKEGINKCESFMNIDTLQNLTWEGFLLNQIKIGEWRAFWKGERINTGGFFNENGIKIGFWIELFKNYWERSPIKLQGVYKNEKKIGRWKIILKNDIFEGGNFDENGLKKGKWIELDDLFYNKCIKYFGIYDKGKKLGLWNTKSQEKIIGGGVYNLNGQKNGFWVELHENYFNQCLVNFSGNYFNGKPQGVWKINYRLNTSNHDQIIGGGIFQDNGLKEGLWTELDENFSQQLEITHQGSYINGKKYKSWKIIKDQNIQIGGGFYDQNGSKHGKWIELDENCLQQFHTVLYFSGDTLTCLGNYHHGIRRGEWKTLFSDKLIGLGNYNLCGIKTGLWIQIRKNFNKYNQAIEIGIYEKGIKVGLWQTRLIMDDIIIGQGQYNKNGLKEGYWIDIDDNNYLNQFSLYQGCYRNGRKIGKWKTYFRIKNDDFLHKKIGGGNYDKNGVKHGKWIELIESFSQNRYVQFSGEYKKGKKQGKWDTLFKRFDDAQKEQLKLIGGGCYHKNGSKQGQWIDLHDEFWTARRTIQYGEYINGIRQGCFIQEKI